MACGRIDKQPFEVKDYSFDFSAELEPGETISLLSCIATNRVTGVDTSATIISSDPAPMVSGMTVIFWLQNGTDGERHNLNIRVQTSKGQKLEGDLDLFIIEER
jgi:hypothetical protein